MQDKCASAHMDAHCLVMSAVHVFTVPITFSIKNLPQEQDRNLILGRCNIQWGRNQRELLLWDFAASTPSRAISVLQQLPVRVPLGASCMQGSPTHP